MKSFRSRKYTCSAPTIIASPLDSTISRKSSGNTHSRFALTGRPDAAWTGM